MYNYQDMEQQTRLLDINSSIRTFLINIISMQFLFHVLVVSLIFSLSFLASYIKLPAINTDGLNSFAIDMWGMLLIVACPGFLYVKIKTIQKIPFYFIAVFPLLSLFFSSTRIASSWIVLILALVSCAIIFQVNHRKIKQQQLEKS